MSLTALFLSICLQTQLPCADVGVSYSDLGKDTHGRATMMSSGRMVIQLHETLEATPHWIQREVMLHEIAHLVVWYENPQKIKSHHGSTFRHICKRLADTVGFGRTSCTRGTS